ncbi:serine/threonine-protein kinase [Plantactinospora soyae]|uniref:Serine/threonine protein kinase n=1 Tax=Plantactinospora soyae TaxID=1544732 RepID=A0A927M657_9ACTN|nr:protein kinase [Plantactinospora soyae]MBE1488449.1 serine/threonine protein kinase [Plantactinospora soyae]
MNPLRRIGPYQVERLLGFGSFATVWLGHDPSLGSRVAIKVLAENWSQDLRVRERFLDEGRLLWRLDHERLVRVYSVGELDDGRPYLVMAWAEGGSLRDRLAAGPMPVARALRVLREIALGVGVLHANGIVHRDLTPGNVLFQPRPSTIEAGRSTEPADESDRTGPDASDPDRADPNRTGPDATDPDSTGPPETDPHKTDPHEAGPDGTAPDRVENATLDPDATESVLIADLGLAKALAAASGLTARAGTPGYMAPEQDASLALVDARTDVFGLGRLGATLLGATPFGATPSPNGSSSPSDDLPSDPVTTPGSGPVLRAGVPAGVAAVLWKATAHRPDDRYPDAMAFTVALDRATGVEPAEPVDRRRRRRSRTLLVAALLAVVVALSAATVAVLTVAWPHRNTDIGEDSTGRITVALPDGWRVSGSGWLGQRGPDGALEPALVMSPDPDRWRRDPSVPGAFVGLSRTLAARHSPVGYVAQHPHAECVAAPVRTVRLGAIDWFVAGFTACQEGKPVIVEAAGIGPDGAGLVHVQVAPPVASTPDFVDTLLAGVRVRP